MFDSKSTFEDAIPQTPRSFDCFYVCDCCGWEKNYPVMAAIPADTEHNEILDELIMYRPFCCEECGNDSMDLFGYEERS